MAAQRLISPIAITTPKLINSGTPAWFEGRYGEQNLEGPAGHFHGVLLQAKISVVHVGVFI